MVSLSFCFQQRISQRYISTVNLVALGNSKEKVHSFPLSRVKKIMKMDELIKLELERENNALDGQENLSSTKLMVAAESPILLGKACELLIKDLSIRAWLHTQKNRRKTVQRSDIEAAVSNNEMFDFLIDVMHKQVWTPSQSNVNPQFFSTVPQSETVQPQMPISHEMVHEIPTISHLGTSTSFTDPRKTPDLQHYESLNHQSQSHLTVSQSEPIDYDSQEKQNAQLHTSSIHHTNIYSANTNAPFHPNDAIILLSPQHPSDSQQSQEMVQDLDHINHQLAMDAPLPGDVHLLSPQYPQQLHDTQEVNQTPFPSYQSVDHKSEFLSTTLQPTGELNISSPQQYQNSHVSQETLNVLHNTDESLLHQHNGPVLSVIEEHRKDENDHTVDHSIPIIREFLGGRRTIH
jgi:nuclear transcription factor Y, gamma